jgi:ABC-type Fe3+ transport system permease subunit
VTPESDLPSLLSAASLLFSVITFLYGLAYNRISSAAAIQVAGTQKEDLGPERRRVREARRVAVFVACVATLIALIFAPPAKDLSQHFFERLPKGLEAFEDYDAVATTLVVITVGCFVLAAHATWMAVRLNRTLKRLS